MGEVDLCGADVTAKWLEEFSLIHHTITLMETKTVKF